MGLFGKKKTGGSEKASPLLDEKQKADIILNSIEDGVVIVDPNNVIQVFNPGATKVTGWDQKEAIGLDYRSIIKLVDDKGQEINEELHPLNKVLKTSQSVREDTAVLSKKDGKPLSVDINASPLLNKEKQAAGAIAIIRDVDNQRREERQRADFISTASHEMRTPVAAIEGYLALALNDKVTKIDARGRSYLEKAHYSTQHLGQLFQDLLTSAKAEDGRLSNNPAVFEFGEFLEKLIEDLRFGAEKKGLKLELLMGAQPRTSTGSIDASKKTVRPLFYVNVDPDRMREAITNLFDNAVKYTESGRISIGLTGDDEVVQFRISDTGPGIPKEDIDHLFQKFYRVDNSITRTVGGTGLGLYICRKVVELYGGRIWVESAVGQGSTFYINLPRLDSSQASKLQTQQNLNRPLIQNTKL